MRRRSFMRLLAVAPALSLGPASTVPASEVDWPEIDWEAVKRSRQFAKTVNFGIFYGMNGGLY